MRAHGLVVDLFAGGGGASVGIEAALGRGVDLAINHDAIALAVHKANHPGTRHLECDVWEARPLEATGGRPVDVLWASPDCTHFSVAKGGKPRKQNIRSLAWVVVRWAAAAKPRVIFLENVSEFRGWGPLGPDGRPDKARMGQTFKRWKGKLEHLGYEVDYRILDASHYGAPTRRRRLFLVARRDGVPIRWPEPTHGPGGLPLRTAAECIDWSLPCPSIFERTRRHHGTIRLTYTAETARDLEWFIQRYPMVGDDEAQARLAKAAGKHREMQSLVDDLLTGVRESRAFPLAIPAREYQRKAAEIALASGGLLLADDVGLGKTCSAICVISEADARPALVVTLTHLPRQWEAEVRRFAPGLSTHILKKGQPYDLRTNGSARQRVLTGMPLPDVVITNYHKLAGWAETLAPLVRTVIFDEGQELRHSDSRKASAARHIAGSAVYRLACTATPIYNYGGEIFNVIDAVRPGALGSISEFHEEWCHGQDEKGRAKIKDPAAFGSFARAAGLMLRRTRAEVGRELPALTRIPHQIECDLEKLEEVESAAAELARVILGQNPSARGEKFRAAEELSGLVRQATGIAKAPYVAEFVRILVANGEKVVLYGWHREVYSLWLERLKDLRPVMYTGTESATQKAASVERFTNGDASVLIMSLRAGAGLDGLQGHVRTVVFGELDWSPGVHEQCIGRVHRDGQADPVVAYFLVADSGSDPIVADVLGVKTAQAAGIRDPNAPLVAQLQADGDHIRRLAEAYLERGAA